VDITIMGATMATEALAGGKRSYWQVTKDPQVILILLLPLFLIYSVGILATGGVRNGVDLVSDFLRGTIFRGSDLAYGITMLAALIAMIFVLAKWREKRIFDPKIYLGVILEGVIYGSLLGTIVVRFLSILGVSALAAGKAGCGVFCNFTLSIGAGLWEEIVFRLLLIGLPAFLLAKLYPERKKRITIVLILVSSLIFSAVHYLGSLGDAFTLYSFLFRFFCGLLFALLYYWRGLAVSAYTHAAYDVMVLVF
jgi:membrane protease YdiL (CAAX protease family)